MENNTSLLVFESITNGTLQVHLKGKFKPARLNWGQRLNIAVQTANFSIYQRDVKSANILLKCHLNAKVADFGISKLAPIEATHVSTATVDGTMGYIDPEYYTSFQLTDKSDVYDFSVVLLEVISAKSPINYRRGGDQTSLVNFAKPHILRGDLRGMLDPTLVEAYSDPTGHEKKSMLDVGRLALKCLDMRSKARPSMKEVWKRLQNLCLELSGASEQLGPLDEDEIDTTARGDDNVVLLFESFAGNSSTFSLFGESGDIEMSLSSRAKRLK